MRNNKKMIVILASAVGAILLIIIVLMLIVGNGSKSLSYSQIEERIVSAGKNYFKDHEDELPTVGTKTVNADKLTKDGYLTDISKRTKDNASCDGTLYVTKTVNDYSYRATLDCGTDYTTKTISNVVIADNLVTTSEGLYATVQINPDSGTLENVYVFKGDNVNNYIKLGDFYWRIVKIYENGEMVVLGDPELLRATWDNRFNIITDNYRGINQYDISRMRDSIDTEVVDDEEGYLIIKSLITTHTACYGNRSLDDTSKDGSTECSSTLPNQYFSLLPLYDYMNASLDPNCNKALDNSCYNYNYLASNNEEWWTITGVADNTEEVYYISNTVEREYANRIRGVRLYAHFDASVTYVSGSGTYEDPYIVK